MAAVAAIMLGRAHSRREQASTFDALPRVSNGPAIDPELPYVNLRSVLASIEAMASFKGWMLYCAYFAFFFGASYRRFDIAAGQETIAWFTDAVSSDYDLIASDDNGWCLDRSNFGLDCYTSFGDRSTVEDLHGFLQHDLSRYLAGIKSYCPDCQIGARALRARGAVGRSAPVRACVRSTGAVPPLPAVAPPPPARRSPLA
jgi:hypothetical protein